jgi:hypothetical protein
MPGKASGMARGGLRAAGQAKAAPPAQEALWGNLAPLE